MARRLAFLPSFRRFDNCRNVQVSCRLVFLVYLFPRTPLFLPAVMGIVGIRDRVIILTF
jgi:hypothetical protein